MKDYELTHQEMADCLDVNGFETVLKAEKAAQKKLLEYLDNLVLYTADDEIGTGEDCNIMLCVTPKMWRDLLKDFGL